MSDRTGIEWTDHTFNIAWGCEKISPGCAHCYADTVSHRYGHDVWGPDAPRRTFGAEHWQEPLRWNARAATAGERARVFCSSMCDVFEDHPTIDAEREKLWPLVRATPWLDWQILTKRPERIIGRLPPDWGFGYPNVWLGTSIENQRFAYRAAILGAIAAEVRFVSAEPLLGPVTLDGLWYVSPKMVPGPLTDAQRHIAPIERVHWLIVGGESGPGHRPMREQWARALRDECAEYGVPFFLKQLGGHADKRGGEKALLDGRRHTDMPERIPA